MRSTTFKHTLRNKRQVNSRASLKGRGLLPRANCVRDWENVQGLLTWNGGVADAQASLGTLALTKDGS